MQDIYDDTDFFPERIIRDDRFINPMLMFDKKDESKPRRIGGIWGVVDEGDAI